MNILVMSKTLWPYGSGGELATYLYATLLNMKGFKIAVAVSDCNVLSRSYGFRTVYLPCIGFGKYSSCINKVQLRRFVERADVVYLSSAFWSLIPFIKRLDKPIVVHLHSYDPVCPVGSLYNFVTASMCSPEDRVCNKCAWLYERYHSRGFTQSVGSTMLNGLIGSVFAKLLSYADALVFVSKTHRDLFLTHLRSIIGRSLPPSYVIYNPVPRHQYIPLYSVDVGYFGGLSPLKGFYLLLRAWLRVCPRYRGVRLFATRMGKFAGDKMLERVGIITYGKLEPSKLDALYLNVRVVTFPSIWQEPLPYVVVEALLRGRLLIASKVGGVTEIVGDAPGVRLVPPGDVDVLVDALEWALSLDKGEVAELGLRNREVTFKRFDNEKSVRELIKVFESVV